MRVFIRPPSHRDKRELIQLALASRPAHRGFVSPAKNDAQFKAYMQRASRDDVEALLLCRRDDEAILGSFTFSQIFYGPFRNAYLGYWIGAPFEGNGYMTEGLGLVLKRGFRVLKLHRVEANIQPNNERSIALVSRAGFRREGYSPRYLKISGRWRDHERWAMTAEEFGK